jgi:hypothetical protein
MLTSDIFKYSELLNVGHITAKHVYLRIAIIMCIDGYLLLRCHGVHMGFWATSDND